MLFFFRSILAQTLLNAYFIFRIQRSKVIPKPVKRLLFLIYGIEIIIYFIGLIAGENLSVKIFDLIQEISGVWVIGHLYMFLLLSLFDLINYCNKKWPFLSQFREKNVRRVKTTCFLVFVVFIGVELYVGYENFLHPVIKTYPFAFNKTDDASARPKATYKILVASDLHLGYIVGRKSLSNYVKFIDEQHADIVIINGDLIDYTLRPLIENRMDEELRQIHARKGVYFIPGNHEYKLDSEANFDWIKQAGLTILKDSVITIDDQLVLIGRDDESNDDRLPIETLMAESDTVKPRIFLAHQPVDIQDACKYNIPLTVCGHTHGGQAFPFNIVGHLLYTYTYGLGHKNKCTFYVTSGLGLSGFPLRIATHSEIVVFNIEIY